MRVIGISPLDQDSTVCLVEDGDIIAAIGEERFSREKQHEGFPYLTLQYLFEHYSLTPESIDRVVYSFFDASKERDLMFRAKYLYDEQAKCTDFGKVFSAFRNLPPVPKKIYNILGVAESKLRIRKGWGKEVFYKVASQVDFVGRKIHEKNLTDGLKGAAADHQYWQEELLKGLDKFNIQNKLIRYEHHMCHAANAYYTSSFDDALIVTLDGYGSGLAGSISVGHNGQIERIHALYYPASLGEFYERVTSSLGFRPGRHEGKIVGLAAYGDPKLLSDTVRSFFDVSEGDVYYKLPRNRFFSRYLASCYAKPEVAAAYQEVLEQVICEYVSYYVRQTGLANVVLSGGVVANVKANQRIFEIPGVKKIFVHPGMGDGGCSVGAALLHVANRIGLHPSPIKDVYLGPEYTDKEIEQALRDEGLSFEKPLNLEKRIAELLTSGKIVAHFNGRMEYGPRALGNRTIMYHAKDPDVNLWLNTQLGRTEFMPFAPATLYEERERCYKNIQGAEHTAQFMTITFDCTDFMLEHCPAAVHVDGTARPQLVAQEANPRFYNIIKEYHKLTGNPSIINTSFNMHEEPIVCTPKDAVRAFVLGNLHYLAIGNYLVAGSKMFTI